MTLLRRTIVGIDAPLNPVMQLEAVFGVRGVAHANTPGQSSVHESQSETFIPYSELFLGRSYVELEGIKRRVLLSQKKICLANRISTHGLPALRSFGVFILDCTVGNDLPSTSSAQTSPPGPEPAGFTHMCPMNPQGRILLGHRLSQTPHGGPTPAIRSELGVRPQGAQRPREDDGPLVSAALSQGRAAVVVKQHADDLLAEGEGATREHLHALHVLLERLLLERLDRRVLDAVHGHAQLQIPEGGVVADGAEGARQPRGRGVGREGLDRAAGGGGAQRLGQLGQVVGVAGEEGDGVVAVGWVGEHAGYAGALGR